MPSLQLSGTNKEILRIAAPIGLALVIPQLNFMTNTAFLGRLGQFPLAVNGIVGIYYLVMYMIAYGLNNGIQVLIARRAGESDRRGISFYFTQGIWMNLVTGLAAVGLSLLFCGFFFTHVLHSRPISQAAIHFIRIRIWGLPLLMLIGLNNAFYVGTANSRVLVITSCVQQGTNILLDYLFIFGKLGIPAMGLYGAAWSSIIAEAAGLICSCVILESGGYVSRFFLLSDWRPQLKKIKEVFRVSAPLILQYGFSIGSWLIFFVFVEHLGEVPLAISNILRSVFGLFGIYSWAFSAGCNTMVSNLIGQGKEDSVPELMQRICRFSFCCAVAVFLTLNLFPAAFLHIYTQDPILVNGARASLEVLSLSTLLSSVAVVVYNGVTGTGHTRVNVVIELVAITFYLVYCWLVIERWRMSLAWAWGSEFVYWVIILVACLVYFRRGKWRVRVI